MSETSDKNRLQGRVQNIFFDKKYGFIRPDDNSDNLCFVAKEVEKDKFEDLKPGNLVTFSVGISKDGKRFANEVVLVNQEDSDTSSISEIRLQGHIKSIFSDKPAGYITFDDSSEDLYFIAKEVDSNGFKSLKIGDAVSFIIGTSKDGRKFANKIKIITDNSTAKNKPLLPENKPPSPVSLSNHITCNELKKQIIEQFKRILLTTDKDEFEDLIFLLLRTLGIHSLYQYDKRNQAGRADGFFIISNLAVMYDCTLRQPFEGYKSDQIENYVNKLEQSQLTFDLRSSDGATKTRKTVNINGKTKQVWIITKGKTREILDHSKIKVKEISVNDLIWLLQMKLNKDVIEEDDLALNLSGIDKLIPS